MSAALDVHGAIHQFVMRPLRAENTFLRSEVRRHGIDPNMLLAAMAQVRRRKKSRRRSSITRR
jgi:hypothetical protein